MCGVVAGAKIIHEYKYTIHFLKKFPVIQRYAI